MGERYREREREKTPTKKNTKHAYTEIEIITKLFQLRGIFNL